MEERRDPGVISLMDTFVGVDSARHKNPSRRKAFFSKSKLALLKCLLLSHSWARDCPVTDAMEEAEVDT